MIVEITQKITVITKKLPIFFLKKKSYLELLSLFLVDPFGRGDPLLESLITDRIADSDDISVWIAAMVNITFLYVYIYFILRQMC